LRKVESSMLKEFGEEKARGALHPNIELREKR
jgi:hypothetical protein